MITLGISKGYHDAAFTFLKDNKILFASHAERYSKVKNDKEISIDLNRFYKPDVTAFYEKSFKKNFRRLIFGQKWKKQEESYDFTFGHHESHAAAGYYTSKFDTCDILIVDAIGEWDTISIWRGENNKLKKISSWWYPYSLGLFYSAITQRIGLKPNRDEYITMGMAAYGSPIHDLKFLLHRNNHKGVGNLLPEARNEDLAASAQKLYDDEFLKLVDLCKHENLVIMGGCALNCVANSKIKNKNIWIMPSPGDAGSSLGAAALVKKEKIEWKNAYLGYNITGSINPHDVVKYLLKHKICGVANGKAEFGPRALGNRSLIGDPRYDIKDTVNTIKRRQKFRPFAPAILEEFADKYFEGPMNEYMQFVAKSKHDYSSVTHFDGTARVQVVKKDCESVIRPILEEWYNKTGCPMILNTSLNIKDEPLVNDETDSLNFQRKYNVRVF